MSTKKTGKKSHHENRPKSGTSETEKEDPKIEKLWKIFSKATPEQRERIIKELDEDMVTELRKRGNPYRQNNLYKQKKGKRVLLCSIFSPLEKYIDRFSMTSLIGFLFRMLDEYTPAEAKQHLSEEDPKFSKLYSEIKDAFKKDKPLQVMQFTVDALEQKLSNINAEIAKSEKKNSAAEAEGISDDEEEVTKEKNLQTERTNVERELDEAHAKLVIHTITCLKDDVKALQPALTSLEKDLNRQKDMRKAIKDRLRTLLKEKEKSEKHAAYNEGTSTPVETSATDTAPVETNAETPATTTETPVAVEAADNIVEEPTPEIDELAAVAESEITPAVNAEVDEMAKEMRKTAQEIVQEKLAQRQKASRKKKEVVRLRELSIIVKELRIYKGKLASATEAVDIAQRRYDIQKSKVDELNKQCAAELETIHKMQEQYYSKWGSPTEKANKLKKRGGPTTAFDHLTFEECEMTDEDEFHMKEEVKQQLGIEWTQEEKSDYILDNIEEFLYEYLSFNPDNHVRSGYRPNYNDPTRTPLKRDPKSGMIVEETWERKLVPPEDTFKRWDRYREANYEPLRQATDDIYAEKSDFEWVIVPLEVFEGENAAEKAEEWERKHALEVDYSIRSVTFNENNLLGPWEKNREATNFYTKETEIIKRMLDAKKDEERIGKDLMKDRVRKKKEENEAELGNDPGLNEYLENNPAGLEKYGAKRVLQNTKNNNGIDVPIDEHALADDEVQVEVIRLGAQRKGRRFRATADNWKFHLPAKPLKEGEVLTHNPQEYQKALSKKD